MYLIVDYDNVDKYDLRFGVERLAQSVLDELGPGILQPLQRLEIRLYGGWFRGNTRTRRAQDLIRDIAGSFGAPFVVASSGGAVAKVTMRASLADSLLAAPGGSFIDTVREYAVDSSRWRQSPVPYKACVAPGSCSLSAVNDVLKSMACPVPTCGVMVSHLLTREEQKLVDTMLIADVLEIARQKAGPIVLVSSDDDVWPGILAATVMGTTVHHFQSKSRSAPAYYRSLASSALYKQYVLKVM